MTPRSQRCIMLWHRILFLVLCQTMVLPTFNTFSLAQTVTTNVTKTAGSSTFVVPLGTTRNIRGGDAVGTNIFHSFQDFTIGAGDAVIFTNLTGLGAILVGNPGGISNIVSRVTGVNPSNIFGNINSSGAFPNASLFLINPRGIVFGPTASLNVGGSVHFSTADYVRMTDGAVFYADLAKSSTLSSATVTAFGFLGPNPPNAILSQGTLSGQQGKTISLIGGDLTIQGDGNPGGKFVSVPSGTVNLISLGQPGSVTPTTPAEVVLNASGPPTITNFSSMGNVLISQGATVNAGAVAIAAGSPGSGTVVIRGGRLTVDSGALIDATYDGTFVGLAAAPIGIDISTTQGVTLQNLGAITANSHTNQAGDIVVSTGTFQINGGVINAFALREGHGSNVVINADSLAITGTAAVIGQIVTNAAGSGSAGNTTITARVVDIGAHGGIGAAASSAGGLGPNPGTGNGGIITVNASQQVTIHDGGELTSTSVAGGKAGAVIVNAPNIALTNGGLINSKAENAGAAGLVQLTGQMITLDGPGTEVSTQTLANAPGGAIQIQAGQLSMFNGAVITASTSGAGAGGNVVVTAGSISLTNGANITTSSTSPNSAAAGTAGNITLASASDITMQNSSVTTSAAQATGGNIKLSAPGMILLDNAKIISSVNGPVGSNGGNISIDPQFVILENGSQILAQAFAGRGGNIDIITNTFLAEPGTVIDASSQLGVSGQITIQSPIQNLAGAIAPLPQNLVSLANLYGQHCAAQKGGQFSSFVQGQRDGLPTQPGDFLSSPLSPELSAPNLQSEDQTPVNLAAVRLGLLDSMSVSRDALSPTAGCRS